MSRRHIHVPRPPIPRPLLSTDAARAVIRAAAATPTRAETICLLTDDAHLPLSCLVVEGGGLPDDVFPVAELVLELSRSTPVGHVVIASCRPGHGVEPADVDRWHELMAGFDEAGVEFLEWFIADEALMVAVTPLIGEASRWPLS